jgi:integrase
VTCGNYVFGSVRTGGRITDIKRGWKSACEAARIVDLHFHDLRHGWSSRAADCGVLEHVRRDILGHSAGSMAGDYTHASPEAMEEAMELVARFKPRRLPAKPHEIRTI